MTSPTPAARIQPVPRQRRARATAHDPRRSILVVLGEHPFVAVATFVHVMFVIGLYSLVIREDEPFEPQAAYVPIGFETRLATSDDTEPESAGGGTEPFPEVRENPGLTEQPEPAQAEPAAAATAPEPRRTMLPDPTAAAARPTYAPTHSTALGSALDGERVEGSGGASDGGVRSGGSMALRNERGRAIGVQQHGGNAASESAVDAGLKWLAHHQFQALIEVETLEPEGDSRRETVPVGYWRPTGFHFDARSLDTGQRITLNIDADSLANNAAYTLGNTGLAILAFLGAGHTPSQGEHHEVVARAMRWLMLQQSPAGRFGMLDLRSRRLQLDRRVLGRALPGDSAYGIANMYNHCLALLAVAECLTMTGDEALRPIVRAGAAYLVRTQNRHGGWDYDPRVDRNDTSITSWALLALKAADAAGVEVPRTVYLRIIHHFKRLTPGDGRTYYTDRLDHLGQQGNTGQSLGMTASSLLARRLLGAPRDDEMVCRQLALVMKGLPDTQQRRNEATNRSGQNPSQNYYAWYVGTLALFLHGGEEWTHWNSVARNTIVESQETLGQLRGTWDTESHWAYAGGRIYTTALMVLTLEVYYRYVPTHLLADARMYERFWQDDHLYAVLGPELRRARDVRGLRR